MGLTQEIARYITESTLDDFSSTAISTAKDGLIDTIACMLAGCNEPLTEILCRYASYTGGTPVSTIVGRDLKTSAPEAALINGASAHAIDYDDVARVMKGHPSVVSLPAALALGEMTSATGRDVLTAYMVGFEVACSLASGMNDAFYDQLGWHPTGPIGAIGSAASASHMLNLDIKETEMALSLAASQASGLRQNFGTMTKPFHAGVASRTGVTSSMLVADGFTSSTIGIEGPAGFLQAFSGGKRYNEDLILYNLRQHSHLGNAGIELKKYPCCGSTHLILDIIIPLVTKTPINISDVERVDVSVDFDPPRSLIYDFPITPLQARFSMQYCVAAAMIDGHIDINSFSTENITRPEVQRFMPKIHMGRNKGFEGQPSWTENFHELQITLASGQELRETVSRLPGRSLPGISPQELEAKFVKCASTRLGNGHIMEALQCLKHFEETPTITGLMDHITVRSVE